MPKRELPTSDVVDELIKQNLIPYGINFREVLHRYWAFSGGTHVYLNKLVDLLEARGYVVDRSARVISGKRT